MNRREFLKEGLALGAMGVVGGRGVFAAENPGLVHPKPEPGKIVVMQCWDDAMLVPASGEWWDRGFWTNYESVKRTGGFFWFWGHSCELADDNALWDKYESMIQRISSDRDAKWIDPIDLFANPVL